MRLPTPSMHDWAPIARYLAGHHGVIDRAALDRFGASRGQIARWVAAGQLERCAPRVWRLVGAPVTWEQRLMTGLLALGPAAAVSHSAAAALHTFDRWPPGSIEFLVPRRQRGTRLDATVHSALTIARGDVVTVGGLRATAATRTIIDLAGTGASTDRIAAAVDSAVRMQLSAPLAIRRRLEMLGRAGRRGVAVLDAVLVDSGSHTALERAFLRLVREAGLPRPQTQAVFRDGRRTVARVDFWFEEHALAVEVSGQLGHSSPAERGRDAQRRNELQAIGVSVYEFTWEQVTAGDGRIASQLRERFEQSGVAATGLPRS